MRTKRETGRRRFVVKGGLAAAAVNLFAGRNARILEDRRARSSFREAPGYMTSA
jgi:hypothetical protein